MRVLMVLPALTEAVSPFFRPIKYSLFPPLGLASLASHLDPDIDEIQIIDEHTMPQVSLKTIPDPIPDLVVIQTYITNAKRSYRIADHYRQAGCRVAIGGLHATSIPDEARPHADHLFLGPGDATFPRFLQDLKSGHPQPVYDSRAHERTLITLPPVRRDLIDRSRYLVPNSIVVTRGCPHHCSFCYKDAFFAGGKSSYTQPVDSALAEIERLPGRHLYFLDDHLLGHTRFAETLFEGMRGMGRVFQGAATVDSILRGDLIERAVGAGLRSIFIGFESLSEQGLSGSNKRQNLGRDYAAAIRRLDELGVMINASFVFGLDGDDSLVFDRTVDWAIESGLTTATFHIATPYPGTAFHHEIESAGRILTRDWNLY
ncbi:MAG: radical SAM protein, partial [Planctomycetota bacterium]